MLFFFFLTELSTVPTTTRSLTACEQLRLSTLNTTIDGYKPKCTVNGEYEPLQCHRRMYSKECWCVDKLGNEITGSKMMQPLVPDCITGIYRKVLYIRLMIFLLENLSKVGRAYNLLDLISNPFFFQHNFPHIMNR